MSERLHRRIQVSDCGGVTVVRLLDRKLLDRDNIQELGDELFALVEDEGRKKIVLTFSAMKFMSSAALDKLILLDRSSKKHNAKLKLCALRPELLEVFVITRLNHMFDIYEEEVEAIASL